MNNTTKETCLNALNETIDCIALDSSSLLDDIELILLSLVALAGIGVFLYKKYTFFKYYIFCYECFESIKSL